MFSTLEEAWSGRASSNRRVTEGFDQQQPPQQPPQQHARFTCERKLDDVMKCPQCRARLSEMFSPAAGSASGLDHLYRRALKLLRQFRKPDEGNQLIVAAAVLVLLLVLFDGI